jgi:two-component system sensor histidine kinase UhpB
VPETSDIPEVGRAARGSFHTDELDAVIVTDASGVITEVNGAACRLTGHPRSALVGMRAQLLVAPEWTDFVLHQRQQKIEAIRKVTRYECVLMSAEGLRVAVEVTSTLIRRDDEVEGLHLILRDARGPVAVERRLRESDERFRGAFEGAAIGMAMVAPDGRWLKVNDALSHLLGYSKGELLELTFQDVTHPEDLERDLDSVRAVLDGEVSWYHMEKRYIRKDGCVIWAMLAVSLVRGAAGEPAYFISQINDISAAKRAELTAREIRTGLGDNGHLSPRETQVLQLLANGYLTAGAAIALGIADETVQTLVKRAMTKLNARNRTQAVASALRLGLL